MQLKEQLSDRTDVVGAWLSIGHPTVAEVTASRGFDFVLVDTEHTPIGLETVEDLSRAVDATEGETEMLVRVPSDDPVRIKRVLDIGVAGVQVPMIETAAEARDVVEATRYPPDGIRGVASGRASEYGDDFQEYVNTANKSVVTVVQIENQTGIENAEEIAAVDGINAVFVGPADLSANLGIFAEWENERLDTAIESVMRAGDAAGVPVGTLAVNPDDIEMRMEQGFDYFIIGKDTSHLSSANEAVLQRYDEASKQTEVPPRED